MRNTKWLFIFPLVFVAACSVQKTSWTEGMRGMAQALEDLFPYIYNQSRFSDPQNKKFINTKLSALNLHADSLDRHVAKGLSGDDPLFSVGLKGLKRNLRRSADSFFVENYDYSQQLLKHSVSYCVKCHMSTRMGRKFFTFDKFAPQDLGTIQPMDLAKSKVALRQFDQAIQVLNGAVESEQVEAKDKMEALKLLLAISVRNMESTKEAAQIVEQAKKQKALVNNQKILDAWYKDLSSWNFKEQGMKPEQALQVRGELTSKDFVKLLRKSFFLHGYLRSHQDRRLRAQVMFTLGQIYEAQPSLGFWELPDQYYEACIYQLPQSQIAKKCFFSLEKRLHQSFQLGVGAALPHAEQEHLNKLEILTKQRDSKSHDGGNYQEL